MKSLLLIMGMAMFLSCTKKEAVKHIVTVSKPKDTISNFMFLTSHAVEGDFDGNGSRETLVSFISDSTGRKVDRIPAGEDWGETLDYVFANGINTRLFIQGSKGDTLNLGTSIGVYCLINLGDLNTDLKDEIALVADWPDYSNLNSVRIYSLCNNKWIEIKTFRVNEGMSFDWEGETMPVFTNIPRALEKHRGKWMFMDFYEWMEADSLEMKPLVVPRCK